MALKSTPIATGIVAVGAGSVVYGVHEVYVPASWIVMGVLLILAGLLADLER